MENQSKNTVSINNEDKYGVALWDDNDVAWDDTIFYWDEINQNMTNSSKNTATITNLTKS